MCHGPYPESIIELYIIFLQHGKVHQVHLQIMVPVYSSRSILFLYLSQ